MAGYIVGINIKSTKYRSTIECYKSHTDNAATSLSVPLLGQCYLHAGPGGSGQHCHRETSMAYAATVTPIATSTHMNHMHQRSFSKSAACNGCVSSC